MSEMSNNGNETLIGVIVGICSALVVIILVMVIAIRKKRNNDQGNLELIVINS
jgi:ABC-type transporter Mla subunit MlaD